VVTKMDRSQSASEPPRRASSRQSAETPTRDWSAWNDWVRAHIRIALQEHDRILIDAVGQFASEYVAKRLREETGKLREEIAALRAAMGKLKGARHAARR
jgi:hypothetical protein